MSKIIHRIWMGSPMPEKFVEYGRQWRSMNPTWTLIDWTEKELRKLDWQNQAVIDQMTEQSKNPNADMIAYYTHLADVMCYELVYKFGGLYINTDIKPIRPLSQLYLDHNSAHLAMEDDHHRVNMAMYASEPNNDFFGKVIENLPGRYFGMPGQGMHITTGVGLLMQTLQEYNGSVVTWHRDVWNPIHWSTIALGTVPNMDIRYPQSTIAVHSWSHKEFKRGHEIL